MPHIPPLRSNSFTDSHNLFKVSHNASNVATIDALNLVAKSLPSHFHANQEKSPKKVCTTQSSTILVWITPTPLLVCNDMNCILLHCIMYLSQLLYIIMICFVIDMHWFFKKLNYYKEYSIFPLIPGLELLFEAQSYQSWWYVMHTILITRVSWRASRWSNLETCQQYITTM